MSTTRIVDSRTAIAIIVAIAAGALGLALLLGGGDDSAPVLDTGTDDPSPSTPDQAGSTVPTSSLEPERPAVDQIDCGPLLTLDEIRAALAVESGGDGSEPFELQDGEVCTEPLFEDRAYFIQIGPGDPADFLPGARYLGVEGRDVAGVGHEARWFGGEPAEGGGDVGVLSVRAGTELGVLHYRIVVGRPDLDSESQLEIAERLALTALPRFPGVRIIEPDLIEILVEPEPVALADLGYAENLLTKEQAGEWTLEEGLVATLRLLLGESEASDVLRDSELVNRSGTPVVLLAREYLETGTDEVAKAEIARLLDELLPSPEEVDALLAQVATSGGSSSEGATEPNETQDAAISGAEPVPLVGIPSKAQNEPPEEPEPTCSPWALDECWQTVPFPDLDAQYGEGKYLILAPEPSIQTNPYYTQTGVDWAKDAIRRAAHEFERHGETPGFVVSLTDLDLYAASDVVVAPHSGKQVCTIDIGQQFIDPDAETLQERHDWFRQELVAEMAYCMIPVAFSNVQHWWHGGLAVYLSGVVFPPVNWEHNKLPERLAAKELGISLFDVSVLNWVFLEFLHPSLGGSNGVVDLLEAFPTLDGAPNIEQQFHEFKQGLTDSDIADLGGGEVPFDPDADFIALEPGMEITAAPRRFGVARVRLSVEPGMKACVTNRTEGDMTVGWRRGVLENPTSDWGVPPSELIGESVLLATSTTPGGRFIMKVLGVIDEEKDCPKPEGEADPAESCGLEFLCDDSGYYFFVPGYGSTRIIEVPGF